MRKNQQLVIVLPEGSEELPIRIVRGSRSMELLYLETERLSQNGSGRNPMDRGCRKLFPHPPDRRSHPRNFFQPRIGQAQAARKRLHPDPSFPHRKPRVSLV